MQKNILVQEKIICRINISRDNLETNLETTCETIQATNSTSLKEI